MKYQCICCGTRCDHVVSQSQIYGQATLDQLPYAISRAILDYFSNKDGSCKQKGCKCAPAERQQRGTYNQYVNFQHYKDLHVIYDQPTPLFVCRSSPSVRAEVGKWLRLKVRQNTAASFECTSIILVVRFVWQPTTVLVWRSRPFPRLIRKETVGYARLATYFSLELACTNSQFLC